MTFQVATRGGVVQHIQVVQGTTVVPDLEEDDGELYQGYAKALFCLLYFFLNLFSLADIFLED